MELIARSVNEHEDCDIELFRCNNMYGTSFSDFNYSSVIFSSTADGYIKKDGSIGKPRDGLNIMSALYWQEFDENFYCGLFDYNNSLQTYALNKFSVLSIDEFNDLQSEIMKSGGLRVNRISLKLLLLNAI